MDLSALITSVKDFRTLVFRPLTLFTFGTICLTSLIMPESFFVWLGLVKHRAWVSMAMIVLYAFGFIRAMDVYVFPWMKRKKRLEKDREHFRRQLGVLSIYELSILAYCLSRNRITFFALDQGRAPFENAVMSLMTRGFFKQGPLAMLGHSFNITDDCWQLLQHFKDDIREKAEAVYPDLEQKFDFYDEYQRTYGFGQVEPPVQKKEIVSELDPRSTSFNYTLYTKDVFDGVIWKWHYKPEFGQRVFNLTPYCLDCERALVPELIDGDEILVNHSDGRRYKYVACSVHRKDHVIPVDEKGRYVIVLGMIFKKIEDEKKKSIVDRQEIQM
jgi:hypothetical protein